MSSVDIDADLGISPDGLAAKLATEAASDKKAKNTWTDVEQQAFARGVDEIAEYDPERRWIKIQRRVRTRSLKECKAYAKALESEARARMRECKRVVESIVQHVIRDQSVEVQVYDAFLGGVVLPLEVRSFC